MSILQSPDELKRKLRRDQEHQKKYKALSNYSGCDKKFKHADYLPLLRRALECGFLGEKEDEFLNYMIDRYSLPYLDWACKTPWLKKEMARVAEQHNAPAPSQPKQFTLYDLIPKQTLQNSFFQWGFHQQSPHQWKHA